MNSILAKLYADENGFIVSGELVLVSTIAVLGLVVGLSEVAGNLNNELEDIGSAFGSMNQSYQTQGACGHKGSSYGSQYKDKADFCDGADIKCTGPANEIGCYHN